MLNAISQEPAMSPPATANHRPQTPPFAALPEQEIRLSSGPVRYREAGDGEPLLFVHGLLVDGRLWHEAAATLAGRHRCIVPDWPLGSHRAPMNADADLAPPAVATLIAEFVAAIGLERVTLVGNDSGGAISQMVAADHGESVSRLILTNCDTFEHFPPFPFSLMGPIARLPGGMSLLTPPFRLGAVRRTTYGMLAREPIAPALVDSWVEPGLHDAAIRRDARKLITGAHKRQTLAAAEKLASFERPALFAWGTADRFFKVAHAERLAAVIPDARIVPIEGAGTFVALDRPQELAEAIGAFLGSPA
jgi:pimeloyl-ACP methyl ester carboxylesterase